jgi:hypothetical protein
MTFRRLMMPPAVALAIASCAAPTPLPTAQLNAGSPAEAAAIESAKAQMDPADRAEAESAASITALEGLKPAPEADILVLRSMLPDAVKEVGHELRFKSDAELVPYLRSIALARPVETYDREGFLKGLGLSPRAPGKVDTDTFWAVRQVAGYSTGIGDGEHVIPSQALAYRIAKGNPIFYRTIAPGVNVGLEAYGRVRGMYRKPFVVAQQPHPTGIPVAARYAPPATAFHVLFDPDMHLGLPGQLTGTESYGTYGIAQRMGFTAEQAARIASTCDNVDNRDKTPYGRTEPLPLGSMDRHFNFNRKGQDTRYVWASRHLEAAVAFGKQSSYDEAEIELGMGLHSLQDSFAHGQLSPCLHGTIGDFPDNVSYDPIAYLEAARATEAYLKRYFDRIGRPATP